MRPGVIRSLFITIFVSSMLYPCTTAIVSGKYTKNGRPLMFKHRDSGFFQNKLMFFNDGDFEYIGLINSADKAGDEVWAGTNSAGFSIMNSASYNLNINDDTKLKDREGVVMKKALQVCKTLADFEKLLDEWPRPMGVEANFGVIDAQGGAAYYETSNFGWKKFDVADSSTAPLGYIVRTNYSVSGKEGAGYGYIRYRTADELFSIAEQSNNITTEFILQSVSRSLKHSMTGVDLNTTKNEFEFFEDFIPRYTSVSSVVVEGTAPGEPVNLTTMWTVLGFPLTSVAVPVWVAAGDNLPEILLADSTGNAPLCDMALELKAKCFPVTQGSGKKYINAKAVVNNSNTGYLQKLAPVETEISSRARNLLAKWEKSSFNKAEALDFYRSVSGYVKSFYSLNLGLK